MFVRRPRFSSQITRRSTTWGFLHTRVPRVLGIHVKTASFVIVGLKPFLASPDNISLHVSPEQVYSPSHADNEKALSSRSIVAMMAATKILHIAREEIRLR